MSAHIDWMTPVRAHVVASRVVNGELISVPIELDNVGPWLVTIDGPHHEIHEGESFYYHDVVTLGSNGTQDYLITVPAGVYPHWGYSIEGIYGVTIEMFEGADRDGTALQTVFGRNRAHSNIPDMTVHKGDSGGTTDGTRIVWKKSGSGAAQGRISGASNDYRERILAPATKYVFRVTSHAASNDVSIEFDWYEEHAPSL